LFHKPKKKGRIYGFRSFTHGKAHGSDSGTTAHIERFIIPKNADPTRTLLNRSLIEYPDGVKDPTDGTRLVLAIDRKPIVEWFKEQFDKLRQSIHRPIQPQRKGRGMKI